MNSQWSRHSYQGKEMGGRKVGKTLCPGPHPPLAPCPVSAQRLSAFSSGVALYLLGLPPSRAAFWPFFFPSSKDPKGGSQGPVAGLSGHLPEAVLSNRKACGVPG